MAKMDPRFNQVFYEDGSQRANLLERHTGEVPPQEGGVRRWCRISVSLNYTFPAIGPEGGDSSPPQG